MSDHGRTLRWLALATAVAASVLGGQALAVTSPTIGIKEFKYTPARVTVPVGTTVTWINRDEEPHTVTAASGAFSSAGLVHDDTFAQTFTKPGTYTYFCALHPHMKATVVVK